MTRGREIEPQGFVDYAAGGGGTAKDVDHVDRPGRRRGARKSPAANEAPGLARIDRIGLEAPGDEKAQHPIGRSRRIGRSADDRDRRDAGQDRPHLIVADAVDRRQVTTPRPAAACRGRRRGLRPSRARRDCRSSPPRQARRPRRAAARSGRRTRACRSPASGPSGLRSCSRAPGLLRARGPREPRG